MLNPSGQSQEGRWPADCFFFRPCGKGAQRLGHLLECWVRYKGNKDEYLNKLFCLGPELSSPGASSGLYIPSLKDQAVPPDLSGYWSWVPSENLWREVRILVTKRRSMWFGLPQDTRLHWRWLKVLAWKQLSNHFEPTTGPTSRPLQEVLGYLWYKEQTPSNFYFPRRSFCFYFGWIA